MKIQLLSSAFWRCPHGVGTLGRCHFSVIVALTVPFPSQTPWVGTATLWWLPVWAQQIPTWRRPWTLCVTLTGPGKSKTNPLSTWTPRQLSCTSWSSRYWDIPQVLSSGKAQPHKKCKLSLLCIAGSLEVAGDISWSFPAARVKWWCWCGLNFPSTQQIIAWWATGTIRDTEMLWCFPDIFLCPAGWEGKNFAWSDPREKWRTF